jgi:biopolymer transport protein TolQ
MLLLGSGPGLFRLVAEAGPVALATLSLLALLSVLTWSCWGSRWLALRRLLRDTRAGRQAFVSAGSAEAFEARSRELPEGPLPRLFAAVRAEQRALMPGSGAWTPTAADAARCAIERTLAARRDQELERARRGLTLLATVGATAPFIGLFGTVWGIMNAFLAIGDTRSADLAVVAPGIAEALTTTGLGLIAAIPAVWAYNSLGLRLRRLGVELDRFAADFLTAQDRAIARQES